MKIMFLALVCIATASAAAQTVTTPPRAMSSQQETPGVDSTFQGDVVPNTQSSSITINTGGGAPAPAPAPAPTPAPAPSPPLAINGQAFSNFLSVPEDNAGGHPSGQAALAFSAWNGGWQIYEMGYQEATTVLATGALPSGAVSVSYSVSGITQDGISLLHRSTKQPRQPLCRLRMTKRWSTLRRPSYGVRPPTYRKVP